MTACTNGSSCPTGSFSHLVCRACVRSSSLVVSEVCKTAKLGITHHGVRHSERHEAQAESEA